MISKSISQFFLFVNLIIVHVYCGEEDIKMIGDYLKRFSNLNVEEILQNDRLFSAYHRCFMDQGPCTSEAREMKNVIPAVVKTACDLCTPEQKKELKKHLDYARYKRAKEWEELLNKFDPQHTSLEKFLSSIPE